MSLTLPLLALLSLQNGPVSVAPNNPNIAYSPYNWHHEGAAYAQTPNPGAYLKLGFTGTSASIEFDVSSFTQANVPAAQYPLVRYSVDNGPAKTVQLTAATTSLKVASGLSATGHQLQLQYVAGYVFLDFWSPVNALRITGFTLDPGAQTTPLDHPKKYALFLGDSITNGDDDTATFETGITNAVETQDATLGYPAVVAAGIGADYGIVAYGGASWNGRAADGHTPGLMTFYSMIDQAHSRLVNGKLSPAPDDIFINMGENAGPKEGDVPTLLTALRKAATPTTNIFLIVPFSGRSRGPLTSGFAAYQVDKRAFLLDLGNNPYLPVGRATMMSVDGQHPLASLHALLGAELVQARAEKIKGI